MDFIKRKHFSLTDWDYKDGAYLAIKTNQFVSAPSSLGTTAMPGGTPDQWIILKDALGLCIPDGRIITYYRHTYGSQYLKLIFRVQDIPTNAFPNNCYFIHLTDSYLILTIRKAGGNTDLKTVSGNWFDAEDQWDYVRLTWWQYITGDLNKCLRITVEWWNGNTWEAILTHDHTDNEWADSATNRVGLILGYASSTHFSWVDDTEIWEKAS